MNAIERNEPILSMDTRDQAMLPNDYRHPVRERNWLPVPSLRSESEKDPVFHPRARAIIAQLGYVREHLQFLNHENFSRHQQDGRYGDVSYGVAKLFKRTFNQLDNMLRLRTGPRLQELLADASYPITRVDDQWRLYLLKGQYVPLCFDEDDIDDDPRWRERLPQDQPQIRPRHKWDEEDSQKGTITADSAGTFKLVL